MSDADRRLLAAFDGHDVDAIRAALADGADAARPIDGKPPIAWLLEQYWRSDRLPECLRLLLARGADLDPPALAAVLLDDADAVAAAVAANSSALRERITLVSTFASLTDVTLLHVAAEYGHLLAAQALLAAGADVDARAGVTPEGLNGHTPLFHVVNSNANRSAPVLRLLLAAGARVDVRLAGLQWGIGFPWETVFFDVTPIAFAQMGLLPQVHRVERDIYDTIRLLVEAGGGTMPVLDNVPNRYLR